MQRVRVLAWVALLAGCGTAPVNSLAPDTYALPVDQVFAKLSTDRLRDAVNAWQCGVPVAIEVEGAPNDAVVWRVLSGGSTQLTLTATLTPLNRSTTKVTLAADDGVNGDKSYNGHQFYPRPVLQQPVLALLREQVNAVLGDRPFDIMNVVEIAHDAPGEVGGKVVRSSVSTTTPTRTPTIRGATATQATVCSGPRQAD